MRSLLLAGVSCVAIGLLSGCSDGGGDDVQQTVHKPLPIDTTFVLPDAVCAAVVNVRQIHESSSAKDRRKIAYWAKALVDALKFTRFDLRTDNLQGDVHPSQIERVTISAATPENGVEFPIMLVVHFKDEHSGRDTIRSYFGLTKGDDAISEEASGEVIYYSVRPNRFLADPSYVYFPDERTAVVTSQEDLLTKLINQPSPSTSPLANKLSSADVSADAMLVTSFDDQRWQIAELLWKISTGQSLGSLPQGLKNAVVTGSLSPEFQLQATCVYPNETSAAEAKESVEGWAQNCLVVLSDELNEAAPAPPEGLTQQATALERILRGLSAEQNGSTLTVRPAKGTDVDGTAAMEGFGTFKLAVVERNRKKFVAQAEFEKTFQRGSSLKPDLTYTLPDAAFGVVVNVHQAMQSPVWESNPQLQMLRPMLQGFLPDFSESGLSVSNIAYVFANLVPATGPNIRESPFSALVQLKSPHSGEGLVEQFVKSKPQPTEITKLQYNGFAYYNLDADSPVGKQLFIHFPDDTTVLFAGPTEQMMQQLLTQDAPPDEPLTKTLAGADMTHDIVFAAVVDERIRDYLQELTKMYLEGDLADVVGRGESAVVSGTFSPNARYEAELNFSDEEAAAEMRAALWKKRDDVRTFVEKRIEQLKPLPDVNLEKQAMPELLAFLNGIRLEQHGQTVKFFVVGLDDMDLLQVREGEKWLMWNSGSDDNETSTADRGYGVSSDEESSATPPIADDSAKIEATIDRRVQYHIDHLTDEKYKTLRPEIRASFCEALGSRGARAEAAIPTLEKVAAEDDDERVREAAKRALEQIQTDLDE